MTKLNELYQIQVILGFKQNSEWDFYTILLQRAIDNNFAIFHRNDYVRLKSGNMEAIRYVNFTDEGVISDIFYNGDDEMAKLDRSDIEDFIQYMLVEESDGPVAQTLLKSDDICCAFIPYAFDEPVSPSRTSLTISYSPAEWNKEAVDLHFSKLCFSRKSHNPNSSWVYKNCSGDKVAISENNINTLVEKTTNVISCFNPTGFIEAALTNGNLEVPWLE